MAVHFVFSDILGLLGSRYYNPKVNCWCGNQYPWSRVKENNLMCDHPWEINATMICRGSWKRTVYATGIVGKDE